MRLKESWRESFYEGRDTQLTPFLPQGRFFFNSELWLRTSADTLETHLGFRLGDKDGTYRIKEHQSELRESLEMI